MKNTPTSEVLKDLFNQFNCDKAKKHRYHEVYAAELDHLRELPFNLLEIGIFKGDSIRAWLEFFPNATIYGIDTFQRVDPKSIDVLQHPRVKWLKGDSTNPGVAFTISKAWGDDIEFDVIIDDGLHTPEANGKTFTIFKSFLSANGMYFIEDVWPLSLMTTKQLNHPWIKKHPNDYTSLKWDFFIRQLGSDPVEIFDLRGKTGEPDSFIYKVTK